MKEEERIQGFGGETVRSRTLRRPSLRWTNNINVYLLTIEWEGVNYIRVG